LKPEIAIDSFPTPAPTWRLEFWNRVLQERGLDGAVKVGDEPGCTAPSGIYASEEAARVLKVAPYLRAKCAFSAMPLTGSQCGYLGNIREWGYGARSYSGTPMEEMTSFNAQRVAAGEKVFWYIHNFLQLDRPAYAHRMFFWTLLRYQVPGAMLFSTCSWDSAGVQECLGDYIIVSSSTEGTLLWPGDRQFLSGTRWEIIRDGIEDCDLNQLLKTRIDTFEAEYPGDALIANYRALLLDTDGVFRTFRENESLPSGYDINLHFGGSPRWGATNNPSNIILARDRRINAPRPRHRRHHSLADKPLQPRATRQPRHQRRQRRPRLGRSVQRARTDRRHPPTRPGKLPAPRSQCRPRRTRGVALQNHR
ncbi:MAG: hypothetical protein NTV12_06990, partial [Verrucomicrobia bacterium]|nr:hypothetical protein [Verrucomicrobiota bacterium]